MNKEVIRLILETQIDGFDRVQRQLVDLSKKFNLDVGSALKEIGKINKEIAQGLIDGSRKAQKELRKNLYEAGIGGIGKAFEMGTKTVVGGLQNAKGALEGTISGALKGFGSATKEMGKDISKAGDRIEKALAKKGKMGAAAGKGINYMTKAVGPLISLLGVAVSALSSLVSLIIDSEARAKDLNKAILDSGIAGGDMAAGFMGASMALDTMRKYATDFRNNMKWGTVAKEQVEIIGAFNEAGYTIREMTGDVTDAAAAMREYANATQVALTYSKLLGQSATQMATHTAEYMESMGAGIGFIEQQFNAVYKTAQLSGFGVKRFYGMVQQATSGMAMYNVRMDEAAGLLLRFGKILGATAGGDLLQSLTKGFMDESMTDRFKRIIVTGEGPMQEIFENTAENTAIAFGQKFETSSLKVKEGITEVMEKAGIDVDFGTVEGREEILDKLKGMDTDTQDKFLAQIRMVDEDMARSMTQLVKTAEGSKGGVKNMAKYLGSLDTGGVLAAEMQISMSRFGKPIHKLDAMQLAALEGIQGLSGEARERMMDLSRGMSGAWGQLSDVAKEVAAGNKKMTDEEQVRMLEQLGGYVNEDGEIMSAALKVNEDGSKTIVKSTEKKLENLGELYQAQSEVIAAASAEGLEANVALAQEIAANTTDIGKILEMGVEYWLEQIYGLVNSIASILGFGMDQETAKAKATTMATAQQRMGETQDKLRETAKDLALAQADAKTKTGEERKIAMDEVKRLEEQQKQQNAEYLVQKSFYERIGKATTKDEFDDTNLYSQVGVKSALSESYGTDVTQELEQRVGGAMWSLKAQMAKEGITMDADTEKTLMDGMMANVYGVLGKSLDQGESLESALASAIDPIVLAAGATELIGDPEAFSGDVSALVDFMNKAKEEGGLGGMMQFGVGAVALGTEVTTTGLAAIAQDTGVAGLIEDSSIGQFLGIDIEDPEAQIREQEKAQEDLKAAKDMQEAAQHLNSITWKEAKDYRKVLSGTMEAGEADYTQWQDIGDYLMKEGLLSTSGDSMVAGVDSWQLIQMMDRIGEIAFMEAGGLGTQGSEDAAWLAIRGITRSLQKEQMSGMVTTYGSGENMTLDNMKLIAQAGVHSQIATLEAEKKGKLGEAEREAIDEEISVLRRMLESDEEMEKLAEEEYQKIKALQKDELSAEEKQKKKQSEEIAENIVEKEAMYQAKQELSAAFGGTFGSVTDEMARAYVEQGGAAAMELVQKAGGDVDALVANFGEKAFRLGVGSDRAGGLYAPDVKTSEDSGGEAKDFIYRPGQSPMKFSSGDTVLGAEPGGPIDKALGGGGGGRNVTINIYGSQGEIYRTVKRVLTETGTV